MREHKALGKHVALWRGADGVVTESEAGKMIGAQLQGLARWPEGLGCGPVARREPFKISEERSKELHFLKTLAALLRHNSRTDLRCSV